MHGTSQVELYGEMLDRIFEGLAQYLQAAELVKQTREGRARKFSVKDGLLVFTQDRVYVLKWGNMIREFMKECHYSPWAGHRGQKRTLALPILLAKDLKGYI